MISTKKESLRPRSKKRAKQEREYYKLRKQFLLDNPFCALHISFPESPCMATQVHHKKGRIGELLTDVRYFLPVCEVGHEWIEKHPIEAKEHGYSLSRLGI